jgi:hypothetical protein
MKPLEIWTIILLTKPKSISWMGRQILTNKNFAHLEAQLIIWTTILLARESAKVHTLL